MRPIRWSGLIPLALLLGLLAVGWTVFGDRIVQSVVAEAASDALGTEVEISGLRLSLADSKVTISRLQIADPRDPMRNLVDAGPLLVDLEAEPLLERKIVISRLAVRGGRNGTRRSRAARVPRNGYLQRTLADVDRFRDQFRVPLLQLVPLDTIRDVLLDPMQLVTVQRAIALHHRADSAKDATAEKWRALALRTTYDTARALVEKYRGVRPVSLGIAGTRTAVRDVRATLAEVEAAKGRVERLHRTVRAGIDSVEDAVRDLDSARRADYAFARGLMKLPTFEGPELGNALFGDVAIDRVAQALYYARIAERYVPPGLMPRETPGPERLRRSGATVAFPIAPSRFPQLHLARGDVEFEVPDAAGRTARYVAVVTDATSEPALVGRPMVVRASRVERGGAVGSVRLHAVMDHRGRVPRDSLVLTAQGIALPRLPLPGLPLAAMPGAGTSGLTVRRVGDALTARWVLRSGALDWAVDTVARFAVASDGADTRHGQARRFVERLVVRVLTGVEDLSLDARVTGTLAAPTVQVNSNLDDAVASSLRGVIGEEVRKAELRLRAKVDALVEERTAPLRAQVADARLDAERRVAEARAELERRRQELEAQLRALGGQVLALPGAATAPAMP